MSSQTSIRLFFSRPGFCWSSRICRLRRIGRPASCRIDNWRVKAVRTFGLTPPMANARLLAVGALFRPRPSSCFLDGDLRDEVAHLPDRGLRFFLAGALR